MCSLKVLDCWCETVGNPNCWIFVGSAWFCIQQTATGNSVDQHHGGLTQCLIFPRFFHARHKRVDYIFVPQNGLLYEYFS